MSDHRELSTSEVASEIGVAPDVLRKWKYRGLLKLAPHGVSGQGRGVECYWSAAAVEEARAFAIAPNAVRDGKRRHKRVMSR